MTGIPGRMTAVTQDAAALPIPSVVDLPAPDDELASDAVAQLGWPGVALAPMTLLGRRVSLVAELLPDAHAERICLGQAPVTDRATVSTWVWPEFQGQVPAAAVRIVGVLAVVRHWRTGLAALAPFARYGDTAMVVPSSVVLTHDYLANCLPRARNYGIAVVSADPDNGVELDLPGRNDKVPAGIDAVSRWVNEVAYERVLSV
nr:FIG01038631: hypothetical protein [Kibdelosporangium sp. MJ126-NF4]CTQ93976.1 FIG01038631: hypothetical protein [Kibdelosporangium sp. MJ126-NF4]